MAATFFDKAVGTTSATFPASVQKGDLAVVFAYRTATTAPSAVAGWITPTGGTVSANSNSARVSWKACIGTEAGTSTGTFTNAVCVILVIYRSAGGIGAVVAASNAASLNTTIPALTLNDTSGASTVVGFAGSKQATSQGTPAGTTLRATQAGVSADTVAVDTNGGVSSWASHTSANGSSVTGAGIAIEILTAYGSVIPTDDFNDNSTNTAIWQDAVDAGVAIAETNGEVEITQTAVGGSGLRITKLPYNLYGQSVFSQLIDAGNQALSMDAIPVILQSPDAQYALFFTIDGNVITSSSVITGTTSNVQSTAPYDPAVHKWFRIRETGTTIVFEFSTDGLSWTNYGTLNQSTFKYGLNGLLLGMQSNIWSGTGTSTVKIDNFNVAPSSGLTARSYISRQAVNRSGTY